MDVKWFKDQQKRAGVTAEDIAARAGRSRSNVSNIYAGGQRMSLHWAQAFAETLGQPLDEVLRRAGIDTAGQSTQTPTGFSDGDAAPFHAAPPQLRKINQRAACFGGDRPGVDVWQVQTSALALNGMLPGDYFLLDTDRAEAARPGDMVVAQHYDWQTGSATTLLRRYEPPVLVAASLDPNERRVLVVDGRNVAIRGVITASWRDMAA